MSYFWQSSFALNSFHQRSAQTTGSGRAAAIIETIRMRKKEEVKEDEKKKNSLQKSYLVSSSPCPLISFLVVSYSVSLVVRGSGPVGDNDL